MSVATKEFMLTARIPRADLVALEGIAKSYGLCRSEALRRVIRTVAAERGLSMTTNKKEVQHEPG